MKFVNVRELRVHPGEVWKQLHLPCCLLLDDRLMHEYSEVLYHDELKLPDPDDQPFLEVAIAGAADFLITSNMKHFPNVEQAVLPKNFISFYRQQYDKG